MQRRTSQSDMQRSRGRSRVDSLGKPDATETISPRPALIVHRWIRLSHGHTKLNFGDMAFSLGLDLRSLQRCFVSAYGINMKRYATAVRIQFVRETLKVSPETKVAVLASQLGYESDKAFIRFVSQHHVKTPQRDLGTGHSQEEFRRSA